MTPTDYSSTGNPDGRKEQIRRARITALVLASSTIISLVFLAYAFVQKQEARKLRNETEQLRTEMENMKNAAMTQAAQAREEAMRQQALAVQLQTELMACRASKK